MKSPSTSTSPGVAAAEVDGDGAATGVVGVAEAIGVNALNAIAVLAITPPARTSTSRRVRPLQRISVLIARVPFGFGPRTTRGDNRELSSRSSRTP
ncbi:hypothetical protein [Amycolatopsis sp. RTGN1]|uniref:hypothetical protein n=1 Tax=Amycolatopsis ponsaeliensis TaxID=2992142 RepID=UPI00254A97B8|nr:hypothetical protein [Amycolatopsis sp. RTGN1]